MDRSKYPGQPTEQRGRMVGFFRPLENVPDARYFLGSVAPPPLSALRKASSILSSFLPVSVRRDIFSATATRPVRYYIYNRLPVSLVDIGSPSARVPSVRTRGGRDALACIAPARRAEGGGKRPERSRERERLVGTD